MIAAVDIGGTKIAAGLIDAEGRVLTRSQVPTDAPAGYRSAIERTAEMLRAAERSTGQKITGIGIGSTGPIFPLTGAIGDVPFFPNWKDENPVRDLESIFKVGVAIENDADAAALGEASWGAGRNKKRLVYVTVGTGIGVGLILDGKVYRGVDYSHPEVGHHVIDPSGPLCSCGFLRLRFGVARQRGTCDGGLVCRERRLCLPASGERFRCANLRTRSRR